MRPPVVLALVAAAAASFAFAYVSLSGDGARREDDAAAPAVVRPTERGEAARPEADLAVADTGDSRTEIEEARIAVAPDDVQGTFANRLYGNVVDPAGVPVQEARVSVYQRRVPAHLEALTILFEEGKRQGALRTTRTNERGEYEFKGLPPGNENVIVVEHENFQRAEAGPIEIGEEGAVREDVQLQEGYQLIGYVREHASGLPVRGAKLMIDTPLAAQLPANRPSPDRREATSGEDGKYEFTHMTPGTKWLMCSAEGYGTVVVNNVTFLAEERHLVQDILMKPELTIAGRVIGPDRQGIKDAAIEATSYSAESLSRGSAKTDAGGNFLIRGLAEGEYALVGRAEGWGEKRVNRVMSGATDVEIELTELGGVMGRVVDCASGRPLGDFRIDVRMVNLSSTYVGRSAVPPKTFTDAQNGAFHISGLAHGNYVVEASAEGYASTRSERFAVTQGLTVPDIVVCMTRGGRITGHVRDGYTNEPIEGAVVVTQDNNWVDSPFTNVFKGLTSRTTTDATARTNGEGAFEFKLLTPEIYQISIQHPSYTAHILNDVAAVEGQDRDIGVIRLFQGGTVSGSAFMSDGSKAVGASVSLHPSNGSGRSYEARTNSAGQYKISNIAPGAYKLSLSRPDLRDGNPFQVIVDMKQSEVELNVTDRGEYTKDLYLGD